MNGQSVNFQVETDLDGPAYFALSVRKCGSSIFNKICTALALHGSRPLVNVGHDFFTANINEADYINDPGLLSLMYPGNIYMSFRSMPRVLLDSKVFRRGRKLVMIRDPRDALVSLYFSSAYSHPIPPSSESGDGAVTQTLTQTLEKHRSLALQMELDDFVMKRAQGMMGTMRAYGSIVRDPQTTILKYEDVILEKRDLIAKISKAFDLNPDEAAIQDILSWADVVPNQEDPTAFVRKVTPGDHREKLRAETISGLNEILRPAMELFGYDA